jgi:hypothetical protein
MTLPLVFIVNGEDVHVDADDAAPLATARDWALRKSRNTGRLPDEWELCDVQGRPILDVLRPVSAYGFAPGTRLFLTLRVGAGGAPCA